MYLLRPVCLVMCLVLLGGCRPFGYQVKRNSEFCCPTDIRQTVPWRAGEDAIFHSPCGPDSDFHGYKPTRWGIWPASGAEWRDAYGGSPIMDYGCQITGEEPESDGAYEAEPIRSDDVFGERVEPELFFAPPQPALPDATIEEEDNAADSRDFDFRRDRISRTRQKVDLEATTTTNRSIVMTAYLTEESHLQKNESNVVQLASIPASRSERPAPRSKNLGHPIPSIQPVSIEFPINTLVPFMR